METESRGKKPKTKIVFVHGNPMKPNQVTGTREVGVVPKDDGQEFPPTIVIDGKSVSWNKLPPLPDIGEQWWQKD